MLLTPTSNLVPGQVLGKSIRGADGSVLLAAGVKLNERLIRRLQDYQISYIYLWDPCLEDVDVRGPLRDETRFKAARQIREVMQDLNRGVQTRVAMGTHLQGLTRVLDDVLNDLAASDKLILDFMDIKTADDYTFFHSVNVCMLSLMLGMRSGLDQRQLKELGLGALIHDIGKTGIPIAILNKPGRLEPEEWDLMKTHTSQGFELLRQSGEISLPACHVALQHHERCDGSGYPKQLKGDKIHRYARMVAIADIYDALTSDRVYRPRFPAHEALELILGSGGTHLDYQLVKRFTRMVAMYPVGSAVTLSNGETGVVTGVSPSNIYRPLVRVLQDPAGQPLDPPLDRDLSEPPVLAVVEVEEPESMAWQTASS